MKKSIIQIKALLQLIDEAYKSKTWHGPNLRGSIRGLSARQVIWRPKPGRHNIWEIVIHCAYWKYVVRRRISGEKKGSFYLKGSNWFKSPKNLDEKAWQNNVKMLDKIHNSMVKTISRLKQSEISKKPAGNKFSTASTISGIAYHDVYHAGQIQLLKRLMKR